MSAAESEEKSPSSSSRPAKPTHCAQCGRSARSITRFLTPPGLSLREHNEQTASLICPACYARNNRATKRSLSQPKTQTKRARSASSTHYHDASERTKRRRRSEVSKEVLQRAGSARSGLELLADLSPQSDPDAVIAEQYSATKKVCKFLSSSPTHKKVLLPVATILTASLPLVKASQITGFEANTLANKRKELNRKNASSASPPSKRVAHNSRANDEPILTNYIALHGTSTSGDQQNNKKRAPFFAFYIWKNSYTSFDTVDLISSFRLFSGRSDHRLPEITWQANYQEFRQFYSQQETGKPPPGHTWFRCHTLLEKYLPTRVDR